MGRWWWAVSPSALVASLVLAFAGAWDAVWVTLVVTLTATALGLRALRPQADLRPVP